MPQIAIIMGSRSDLPKLESAIETFKDFLIDVEVRIMSAHRTPEVVSEFSRNAEKNGFKILLAAAGGAAHLAGVVAAHSRLPVIGIPIQGGAFQGFDSLLSTVQMPGGVPVASVAVGSSGAKNAALFAIRILALTDDEIRRKLLKFNERQAQAVIQADQNLKSEL